MITLESVLVVIGVIAFCIWAFREPLEPVKEWLLKKYNEIRQKNYYEVQPDNSFHYLFSNPDADGGFE